MEQERGEDQVEGGGHQSPHVAAPSLDGDGAIPIMLVSPQQAVCGLFNLFGQIVSFP